MSIDGRHCDRCERLAPPEESDAFSPWEVLAGSGGDRIICPDCITGAEQQAMDEEDMVPAKVRENRLRRMAQRRGLNLSKSRRRDPRAIDYGTYSVLDARTNTVVAAGDHHNGYGLGLDDVDAFLTQSITPTIPCGREIAGEITAAIHDLAEELGHPADPNDAATLDNAIQASFGLARLARLAGAVATGTVDHIHAQYGDEDEDDL